MVNALDRLLYDVKVNFGRDVYTFCSEEISEEMNITRGSNLKSSLAEGSEAVVKGYVEFISADKIFIVKQDQWKTLNVGFLRNQLVNKLSLNSATACLIHKGHKLEEDEVLIADLFMRQKNYKKLGKTSDVIKIVLIASKEEEVKSLMELESNEKAELLEFCSKSSDSDSSSSSSSDSSSSSSSSSESESDEFSPPVTRRKPTAKRVFDRCELRSSSSRRSALIPR